MNKNQKQSQQPLALLLCAINMPQYAERIPLIEAENL